MLENFLKQLGANTKITVGVSVSPGIGLEMIEIDRVTKTVSKYAYRPLEYNYSTREVSDYSAFQEALEELFEELHIPKKNNIVLNVPNVHFGLINLPLLLPDESITNGIVSEVEQSYIFKRQEPIIAWQESFSNIETENRCFVYTALQQSALEGYQAACQEVGCTLLAVENSHSSFIKTLYYANFAQDQMKDGVTWNLMIVGQNCYSIFSMLGKKILEYYEEPLALKSFVDDEIYNAISSSAQIVLAGLPANYLFIASETDLVSAEVLSLKLHFEGQVKFLECNKYSQHEIIPVNLNILPNIASKITPEIIGAGIYPFCDYPLKFNLTGDNVASSPDSEDGKPIPKINIGSVELELTPEFTSKLSLIVGAAILVPLIIIGLIIGHFANKMQTELDDVNTKITSINQEMEKYSHNGSGGAFDVNATMQKITANLRKEMFYFSALRLSVPNKLWITYYMTNASAKIDIKGQATNVESIYTFYKNLKQLVNNADIKLYKLEIISESIEDVVDNSGQGPKYYEFEITNMSETELNPPKAGEAQAGADAKKDDQKGILDMGKSIFGGKGGQPAGPGTSPQPPLPGQQAPAPSPSPSPNPSSSGGDQLPKNLQSIEKF